MTLCKLFSKYVEKNCCKKIKARSKLKNSNFKLIKLVTKYFYLEIVYSSFTKHNDRL